MGRSRLRPALAVAGIAIVAAAGVTWITPDLEDHPIRLSDFDAEVRALDADINGLAAAPGESLAPDRAMRLAHRLYRRGTLAPHSTDFDMLQNLLNGLKSRLGPQRDMSILQATVDLQFHRIGAARDALTRSGYEDDETRMLSADIDVQLGRYEAARRTCEGIVHARPTWPALARLAFLTARQGDAAGADRLYAQAEDDVTAKEMRSYAWLKLQRGQLAFTRGRYDAAQAHYEVAERAYSGYWLADEYVAELLAARGRFDEAIARYQRAIARAPRPDLFQQLGDLYAFIGRGDDAKPWHQRALDGYLASIAKGEVRFLHHLAGFHSDVARDGARAVKWARQDAELRPHYATEDALAWALYANGEVAEAVRVSDRALAAGIVDGHLYYHASMIKAAAGDAPGAAKWRAALNELNPVYRNFHVHR